MKTKQKLIYIICTGLLLLTGCFGGMSPTSSFFILSFDSSLPIISPMKTSVGVWPVQVPDFLDRPQIVLNKTTTQLNISEINRWSEPVALITQRALIENLQHQLPNSYVQTKGYDNNRFKYLVRVEIINMSGILGQTADLSVWWILENNAGQEITRVRFEESTTCGKTYADYVQSQNKLWGKLSEQIAIRLAK